VALTVAALFLWPHPAHKAPAQEASGAPALRHLQMPPHTAPLSNLSAAKHAGPSSERPREGAAQGKGAGTVAIIIDDMGTSTQELQALLSIKLPLTFSVIPSLAQAGAVAKGAHGAGAEVMVHMPMEPVGYPKQPMEKCGLLVSMDDAEIAQRVSGYFKMVPFAAGANNHMGSRFTQEAGKMEAVLRVLKEKGVFFVDSRTSPASVGYQKARELGVKCGTRQVFLDNVQEEGAIGRQLQEVAEIARKRGSAIAIGHPHPATIRALKAVMPELAKGGIRFVHASELTS